MALGATALGAEDKSLSWSMLESDAFLDKEGNLHITETQTIVFHGDYNGGERRFPMQMRLESGPFVKFEGIERLDKETWTPLQYGNLERNHHYEYDRWNGLVRWRARYPSDPPFRGESLQYRLKFIWPQVLKRTDSGIVLDHDFAFPDREGVIKAFRTRLRVHPSWSARDLNTDWIESGALFPGAGFTRRVVFDIPHNVPFPYKTRAEQLLYRASALGAVPVLIAFFLWFARREKETGLIVDHEADEAWIREVFMNYPPEVIADVHGSPDHTLNTLLMRLHLEKLLDHKDGFFVRVGAPDSREQKFLDRLFPPGKTSASAEEIAAYRQEKNLGELRWDAWTAAYDWRTQNNLERYDPDIRWFAHPLLWMFAFLVFTCIAYILTDLAPLELLGVLGFAAIALPFMRRQKAGTRPFIRSRNIAFSHALLFLAAMISMPVLTYSSLWLLPLAAAVYFISILQARSVRPARVALFWEDLAARGRAFFERELKKNKSVFEDVWAPYLLALGLSGAAETWLRSSSERQALRGGDAGDSSSRGQRETENGEPRSSAPEPAQSTGSTGGGRFGGAGATASWAESLTIAAMSAKSADKSSAAASSSSESSSSSDSSSDSSSGSSGSGSGSSGGGGGGGW